MYKCTFADLLLSMMIILPHELGGQLNEHSSLECTDPLSSQECDLNKGLIFLKERDILLTTDTWTIVVSIGTEDYDEIITKIDALLDYLESQQNSTHVRPLIPYYEISQLKTNLKTTKTQVSNIKLLLPSRRQKRGLINGLGSAFKFLFGTLDEDDYQSLNSKIDSLETNSNSIIHVESDRLTYMKRLTSEVESHLKAIQLIVNKLKLTANEFKSMNFSIWTEIEQVKRQLQYQTKISSLFREIEVTLNLINVQLLQMQQALDVTSTEYLSSLLVTPAKLNEALEEVVKQLPVGLSLIVGTELDKVYNYYRIAKVHAISIRNVIRLIIEIPLQSVRSEFELFTVKSLPYYDKILTQYVTIRSETEYFAIASNRMSYVLLNYEQVQQCVKTDYGICPLSVPVLPMTVRSCAFAMFTGNDEQSHQTCKREVVVNYTKPTLYAGVNGNFWVYSMPKPTRVTIQCFTSKNSLKVMNPQTKFLRGTGILPNTRNCYIYSELFTLFPHSKGTTFTNVQTSHMVIPSIHSTLTFSEMKTFRPNNETASDDITADIQDILNNVTSPVDLVSITELQRRLELIREQRSTHSYSFSFITVVVLTAVFLTTSAIAFVCGIRHNARMRKIFRPTSVITTTASQPAPPSEVIYEEIQDNAAVRFVRGPVTS